MSESNLSLAFRNYLIENKIPVALIDFEKSVIDAGADYQVLVLREPNETALEIESIEWTHPAQAVLLVYNTASREVATIPLNFTSSSAELADVNPIDFSDFRSLAIYEGHIMLLADGQRPHHNGPCTYIALLTAAGQLVTIWQIGNSSQYNSEIQDFSQLKPGYWAVKLETDEEKQYDPEVTSLHLFSVDRLGDYDLDLGSEANPLIGSLLDSNADEIKSWFGEEVEGQASFFVLAGAYQFCIYRRPAGPDRHYKKVADVTIDDVTAERSFIQNISVTLANGGITVGFEDTNKSVKFGSFHMSF